MVLALLGVIALGLGLSVIATLTDSIRGTVTKSYEQTWRAPYDILVHMPLPDGTKLPTITEPNLLTTLPPGISVEQWQRIRALPGVQVAAPIAVVGYVRTGPSLGFPSDQTLLNPGAGLYRLTARVGSTASGRAEELIEQHIVAVADPATGALPPGAPADAFVVGTNQRAVGVGAGIPTFLVGIDPTAENQLNGLDGALTEGSGLVSGESISRFTMQMQGATNSGPTNGIPGAVIPVLVNQHGLRDLTYTLTLEVLNADQQVTRKVTERTWNGEQLAQVIRLGQGDRNFYSVLGQSGPLQYKSVPSPHPEHWPTALALQPQPNRLDSLWNRSSPNFTTIATLGDAWRTWTPLSEVLFKYQVKGFFDSAKLATVRSPIAELPLMTYRPAEVKRALDPSGRPVNPPERLSGGLSPVGYLSSPPALLTTIEGAVALAGEKAISAIQMKVAGADQFTPESIARVRQLAASIEQQTGLVAEVTMGSSPVNVLVQVPGQGWVESVWIHKDAAVTNVEQVEFGYSAYTALVVLVAGLYALASGLTGVTARRRELGVAIALGWPESALRRLVIGEQLLFALATGLLAALVAALTKAAPGRVFGIVGVALLVYLPAMLASARAAVRTAPGEALRWGDTAPGRRVVPGSGILALALASLMGRPGRTLLTVIATALPTSLLVLLLFISHYLQGLLYTTITGEYAAVKAGPLQYTAGMIALAIAAVTAFDLIRQNAVDHRNERALCNALGWPRSWIAATMVLEGTLLGLAAGLLGDVLGIGVLALLYGSAAVGALKVALIVWTVPLLLGSLTGLLSSLAELRTWKRVSLASVLPNEVAQLGKSTRFVAGAVALALVGAAGALLLSRQVASWAAKEVGATVSPTRQAAAAIQAVVDEQNRALNRADLDGYLATLDAASEPFIMEERHWLEDLQYWKATAANGRITRSITKLTFAGTNTAHVWLMLKVEGGSAPATLLETVWIKTAEGRWLIHGLDHQVRTAGAVTLWYPEGMDPALVEATIAQVQQALIDLHHVGFDPAEPVILEIKQGPDAFHASLGPYLATAGVAQFWTAYGEPLRLFTFEEPPSAAGIAYYLALKAVDERAHNHAPLWLREGARLYLDAQMSGLSLADELQRFPHADLVSPAEFRAFPGNPDRNSTDYVRVSTSGLRFTWFLQTAFGPETLPRILDDLAEAPPDPRSSDPQIEAVRNQEAIAAIERATGTTWADLTQRFMIWGQQQLGR